VWLQSIENLALVHGTLANVQYLLSSDVLAAAAASMAHGRNIAKFIALEH
jgi:hypothetical protein